MFGCLLGAVLLARVLSDEDEDVDPEDKEDFDELNEDIQEMVRDGDITMDEARDLLTA